MVELLSKWRRATARLSDELGRTPTPEELARVLGLPRKKLPIIKKAIRIYNSTPQTDQAEAGWSLGEMIMDDRIQNPEDVMLVTDEDLPYLRRLALTYRTFDEITMPSRNEYDSIIFSYLTDDGTPGVIEANFTFTSSNYELEGTRGRRLLNGEPAVKIHGQFIPVRARVDRIESMSAHADAGEILRWLRQFERPPAMTYVVHGEPPAMDALQAFAEDASVRFHTAAAPPAISSERPS